MPERLARILAVAVTLMLVMVGQGDAGELASGGDSQATFVLRLAEAINAKDTVRLVQLIHPQCRACMTSENADVYQDVFARRLRDPIPQEYRLSVRPIQANAPLPFSDMVTYPVRPTHVVQIDFQTGPHRNKSLLIQIAEEGGQWYEILPCPTPDAVKRFREGKIAQQRDMQKVQSLRGQLQEPLLSLLRTLLKEGKRLDAIKKYSAETGEDLTMATQVMRLLESEQGE
jgi:hypothetical protein